MPAALPLKLNLQDNPPRLQCVPRGEEVNLICAVQSQSSPYRSRVSTFRCRDSPTSANVHNPGEVFVLHSSPMIRTKNGTITIAPALPGFNFTVTVSHYYYYFREILSRSADNLPALCLDNCSLTPSPLRENRTLTATAMSPSPPYRSRVSTFRCRDSPTSANVHNPVKVVVYSSPVIRNNNGTITIAPALPKDEGEHRFNFTASPHAWKKSRQMFGHLGSNFSIPCLVEIGPISRQQGFTVEWIQRTQQRTELLLNVLIQYEGNASEADTTLIPSSFDSTHVFNVSDLSLLVYDFSVPDVNRKEIYYTCRVSAGPQRQQQASAMINVTIQFSTCKFLSCSLLIRWMQLMIVSPLPSFGTRSTY